MAAIKKERVKSLQCDPAVHQRFKVFVVKQNDGSMQEWVDRLITEGMERVETDQAKGEAA